MIKTYKATYAEDFDMLIEIDHDVMTEANLHEINNFWGGAERRLADSDTVLLAVLKNLCVTFMDESVQRLDPMASFKNGDVEGWPPLDGSQGIKVLKFDAFGFEDGRVEIEEVTA